MRDYIYDPRLPIMRMRMAVEPNRQPMGARTAPVLGRHVDITDDHPGPLTPGLACDMRELGCEPPPVVTGQGDQQSGDAAKGFVLATPMALFLWTVLITIGLWAGGCWR